jgi:hypothetical protein
MRGGNGALSGLSTDELRAAVRAVLRDVLPAGVTDAARASRAARDGTIEQVSLHSDGDLDAFVRRVAVLCEDPSQRAALAEGRRRFRLVAGGPADPETGEHSATGAAGGVLRVEQGAVTERRVKQAAAEGARLVLGRKAVLTPLARDKARTLGVVVEKER